MNSFSVKIAVVIVACAAFAYGQENAKDKRQVGKSGLIDSEEDREVAETGFGAQLGGHGKYFQYAHNPEKDHYEFGHRRGNEHHFIERHEKAHPHAGEFKTKVRWGDKHGGYGEHYWDYNHAGHHDGDGEESQAVEEYEHYEGASSKKHPIQASLVKNTPREKRQPADKSGSDFVYYPSSGLVYDQATGQSFKLEPIN